ncbi:hypothetical protein JOF48_003817 [Arthrobacter stackebrandtii]|uniref:Lysoplasmalogenase n=1 Tax=Arthrobacter stackebrandtii TaxID=272161 RepID=A0ABS4Z445_9MICC|nr:lysoplasmalogenase [Arthrobacter stackebrandtii]MBP2415018.1 hypothetical protein [Arthrobacter stackebrandtii]
MTFNVGAPVRRASRLWWGFAPFAAFSVLHAAILLAGGGPLAQPTKLLLMPALAVAVLWGLPRASRHPLRGGPGLLLSAILFSWLGDGAGTFFPFAPTLPLMLAFFGVAHLCYMRLFWRRLALRRIPWWAIIYAAWWVGLLLFMWPRTGPLAPAVAAYGLVLAGTAALSTRCNPFIVWGAALFLASDTILSFTLFAPELMPAYSGAAVMASYTAGQGLIAAGSLAHLAGTRRRTSP